MLEGLNDKQLAKEFKATAKDIKSKDNTIKVNAINKLNDGTSSLWQRIYGETELSHDRIMNHESGKDFCKNIVEDFRKFLNSNNYDPNKYKIVIGHCVQYTSTHFNQLNTSYYNIIQQDSVKQVYGGQSVSGHFYPGFNLKYSGDDANYEQNNWMHNQSLIFGISMECPDDTRLKHKIFKVDIGSSRGFDLMENIDKVISENDRNTLLTNEKQYFFSRTPQVLQIQNNTEKIIKSQMKNTRIHQPRKVYENKITEGLQQKPVLSELNLNSGNYMKKYLKYKQKYLQLKLQIDKQNN